MRSSGRTFAAWTPLAVALVAAGNAAFVAGVDAAIWAFFAGIVLLAAGLAGLHGMLAARYGAVGWVGFVMTELALVTIFLPLYGLGYAVLIPAGVALVLGLLRMEPRLWGPALAIVAVWPLAAALAALGPLQFGEALAVVFALPYAWLAWDARRVAAAPAE